MSLSQSVPRNSELLRLSFGGAFVGSIGRWIPQRPTTLLRYVHMLVEAYATSRHTFGNFERAATRCRQVGLSDVADIILKKAQEERGHELLAERDLLSLGYIAHDAERTTPPRRGRHLSKLLSHYANVDHPISCLGYAYSLEYYSTFRDGNFMAEIESILPKETNASRCFSVHSGAGSDTLHMTELEEFVDVIDVTLFAYILAATYETAAALATPLDDDFLSDCELQSRYSNARCDEH